MANPIKTNPIKTLVKDFGWIHMSVGVAGNMLFVVGSILFLPMFSALTPIPVDIFIVGSSLMLVGAIGQLLVKLWKDDETE